jgi:N-formylglutamate deformylase
MILPGVYERREPAGETVPLVYDSPHSGRHYPADFGSALPEAVLRQAEDAYVDELIADAPALGVATLCALFPRAYIDPNRTEDDVDPALLAAPWPRPLAPGDKTRLGIGLIRRVVAPGLPIYARRLATTEIERRIARYHRPYLAALERLVHATHARFGRVWHVHWHSMKPRGNASTPDGAGSCRADFVLGDLHGTACAPELTAAVRTFLEAHGHRVALNRPYAGAAIPRRLAAPMRGIHCLQIEINRALYLDEATVTKSPGFDALRTTIRTLTRHLAAVASGTPAAGR